MQCPKGSETFKESPEMVSSCPARYMFLYMNKTSVHLHYTSLSVLEYALVTGHKTGKCNVMLS